MAAFGGGGESGFTAGGGMTAVTFAGPELVAGAEATGRGFEDVNQPWLNPTATAPNSTARNSQSGTPASRITASRQVGLRARPRRRGPIGKIGVRPEARLEERPLLSAPRLLRRRAVMPECLPLSLGMPALLSYLLPSPEPPPALDPPSRPCYKRVLSHSQGAGTGPPKDLKCFS